MTTWRDDANQTIRVALREGRELGLTGKQLRDFINERYPYGPRKYHPYKIWCSELKQVLADQEKLAAWTGKTNG